MTYGVDVAESRYDNVLIAVLSEDGSLLFSTLFGGSRDAYGMGIAYHSNDSIVIAGCTSSLDFPLKDAYQESNSGEEDMFIMKVSLNGLIDVPAGLPFDAITGNVVVSAVLIFLVVLVVLRKSARI
jgi:hypothetical protein